MYDEFDDDVPTQPQQDQAKIDLLQVIAEHLREISASLTAIFWVMFIVFGIWLYRTFIK